MMKTIGVLTSGGDSQGMNAAIRAVVLEGLGKGIRVLGIYGGYAGLMNREVRELTYQDVDGIISNGGTMLGTSRCPEMMTLEGQKAAADICREFGIEGLVVIGGDGSFQGAQKLQDQGISVIALPGTIDGDVALTDYTIGLDTAVNIAMRSADEIRDTCDAHACVCIVEVMGRRCGTIALFAGISTGAEMILVPEKAMPSVEEIVKDIERRRALGARSYIIMNAEGAADTDKLAADIEAATGIHTRKTVLGFTQRGGRPTCRERVNASMMGVRAVDLLADGKTNRAVIHREGRFIDVSIDDLLTQKADLRDELYNGKKYL